MKHRIRQATVLVVFLATTFFYPLLAPPAHRIDLDHLRLIRPGMTEADVEAILAVPAGGYDWVEPDENSRIDALICMDSGIFDVAPIDQLAFSGRTMFICSRHGPNPRFKTWVSRHGVYHVALNEHGRVAATGAWGSVRPSWRIWWKRILGQ